MNRTKRTIFISCAATFLFLALTAHPIFALKPGDLVEDFSLVSVNGQEFRLSNYDQQIVCLIFWSAGSPLTKAYENRILRLFSDFALKGVQFFGIDSNVNESIEQIQRAAADREMPFPILFDEGSKIADYFEAKETPEVFILNHEARLVYRGGIDDESWANHRPMKHYVHDVLDALISGASPSIQETKVYGNKIKRIKK